MLSASQCQVVAWEDESGNLLCVSCAREAVDNDVLWFKHMNGMDDLVTPDMERLNPVSRFDVNEMYGYECAECGAGYPARCTNCDEEIS